MPLLSPRSTSTWPRTLCHPLFAQSQTTELKWPCLQELADLIAATCAEVQISPLAPARLPELYTLLPLQVLNCLERERIQRILWMPPHMAGSLSQRILKKISIGVQNEGRMDRDGEWVGPSQEEREKLELRKNSRKEVAASPSIRGEAVITTISRENSQLSSSSWPLRIWWYKPNPI